MSTRAVALGGSAAPARGAVRAIALAAFAACLCWLLVAHAFRHVSAVRRLPAGATQALPRAAREPVSAALGGARRSYWFNFSGGAAIARNPAQALDVRLARAGLSITSGKAKLAMHLAAVGLDGNLRAAQPAVIHASANRVVLTRGPLSEWYENGPLGLEQGFTIRRLPPAGSTRTPATLELELALGGNARALAAGASGVSFRSPDGGRLAYSQLSALDARGRRLPSWLSLSRGSLMLHVRLAGARFPVRIDPLLSGAEGELELEREASGTSESGSPFKNEFFGTSVALSGDGNTALVGAPSEGSRPGDAWVFARNGAQWVQQQEFTEPAAGTPNGKQRCEPPAEPAGCLFGQSVSLSGDGNVAIVGDPPMHNGAGAAFIYARSGTVWTMAGELSAPGEGGASAFGEAVAVAEDGDTVLVGAPDSHHGVGGAWSYRRGSGAWSTVGEALELPEAGRGARLGQSVAISADGTEAVLGAPEADGNSGKAFTFAYGSASWHEVSALSGEGVAGEALYGSSVALSSDGATAIVGAPRDSGSLERAGAAWLFSLEGASPVGPSVKLTGGNAEAAAEAGEEFGGATSLSADGSKALVGASRYRGKAGVAWLFAREGSGWSRPIAVTAVTETNRDARFASSVSLDASGQTLLGGGPHANEKEGAAWLFGDRPVIDSMEPGKGPHTGDTQVTIVGENFEEVRAVRFGKTPATSFEVLSPEKIIAVSPPGEGEVKVTVETQGWLSEPLNTADQFKYTDKGSGSGGGEGGGGEHKSGGEHPTGGSSSGGGGGQVSSTALPTGLIIPTEARLGVLGKTSRSTPCAVHSKSATISVSASARAALTLVASGSGHCAGRITLRVSIKVAGRTHAESLGSAGYSLGAGHRQSLVVKLDALARALLRAHKGRLKAALLINRSKPQPARAFTASVTLARHP